MKIQHDTTHYAMQVMKRNKKILNVRSLGYTLKSHRKCLQSLKYSYFNVSRPHSNKNPDLIRHDINLIFYPNFILNYHYSDQISKKAKSLKPCVFKSFSDSFWLREKDSNLRPPGYEPGKLPTAPPRDIKKGLIPERSHGAGDRGRTGTVAMTIGF